MKDSWKTDEKYLEKLLPFRPKTAMRREKKQNKTSWWRPKCLHAGPTPKIKILPNLIAMGLVKAEI